VRGQGIAGYETFDIFGTIEHKNNKKNAALASFFSKSHSPHTDIFAVPLPLTPTKLARLGQEREGISVVLARRLGMPPNCIQSRLATAP